MRRIKVALVAAIVMTALPIGGDHFAARPASSVEAKSLYSGVYSHGQTLSPIWPPVIRQWSPLIIREAQANGLDPDFIAAIIDAESNGDDQVVSYAGAVGLMGVMPTGPGLEWRPSTETLKDPEINVNWGVAILTKILQQSGGDITAALAAYSGGWDQANRGVPKRYARQVLNNYGRAVAFRENISPEIASEWTVATEITRGHIPAESLILSDQPLSGLWKYGEHVVYNYVDQDGRAYYVKGFAVPLALVVPLESKGDDLGSDSVADQLMVRLGLSETKIYDSNPRVIKACLPSLARLRGQLATRWYAPSGCPGWHR